MVAASGARLITDGLKLCLDFGNKKSFKGAPITNRQYNNGSEIGPWAVGGINTNVTGLIPAPVPNAKTWKFQKTGTSNQWNGWESSYGGIWTGSAGDYWTTSYWYKTSAPAGATSFGVGRFYLPDWSRAYSTTLIDNVSSIIPDGEWHYNYTVVRINEAYTNAIIADGPSWGYSTSAGELYINGLQWNKNSYATHWVPGTYSASQSLKDLTNNRTTNTLNMVYPQGGGKSSSQTYPYLDAPTGTAALATDSSSVLNTDTHSIFFTVRFNTTSTYGSNGFSGSWDKIFGFNGGGSDRSPGIWRYPSDRKIHWRYDPGNSDSDFSADATTTYPTSGTPFAIDTWYYVGVTKNNGITSVYVNGKLLGTRSVSYPKTAGDATVNLFEYTTGTNSLHSIGVLHVYDRVLSADEVATNFYSIRSRFGI